MLMVPSATGTRCAGSSSRAMAYASGKTPPPPPMITRPTITIVSVCASAAITAPTTYAPSVMRSIRFLPNMSPSRPKMPVRTAEEMKKALITHATEDADAPNSSCMWGSAGATIVCEIAYVRPPHARIATVRR
jgi:hypothetical protein